MQIKILLHYEERTEEKLKLGAVVLTDIFKPFVMDSIMTSFHTANKTLWHRLPHDRIFLSYRDTSVFPLITCHSFSQADQDAACCLIWKVNQNQNINKLLLKTDLVCILLPNGITPYPTFIKCKVTYWSVKYSLSQLWQPNSNQNPDHPPA